jgi:hypothetical protein
LQKFAEGNFSKIKNKNLIQKDLKSEAVFTKEHSFGRIFKVIPQQNVKQLSLIW